MNIAWACPSFAEIQLFIRRMGKQGYIYRPLCHKASDTTLQTNHEPSKELNLSDEDA